MIKRIKLIFYITSATILGLATIWQIYSVRSVMISIGSKQLDAELSQVQDVVQLWKKRQPFSQGSSIATPSATQKKVSETTSTPTEREDKEATSSAEN